MFIAYSLFVIIQIVLRCNGTQLEQSISIRLYVYIKLNRNVRVTIYWNSS